MTGALWLKDTTNYLHWPFSHVFRILQLSSCLAASTSNSFCHIHLSGRLTLDHDLASVVYAWVCCFSTRLERCIIPGQQQRTLQQIPSANQVTVTTPTISSISAVTPTRLISEIQGLGTSGSCTEHPGDCVVFCSTHRCQRLCFSLIVRSLWWRKRWSVKLIGHGIFKYWHKTVNFPVKINYHKSPYFLLKHTYNIHSKYIWAYICIYVCVRLKFEDKKASLTLYAFVCPKKMGEELYTGWTLLSHIAQC